MAPLPLSAQLHAAGTHLELDRVCDCRIEQARSSFPAVHLPHDHWTVLGQPDDLDYYDRDWVDAQAWIVERVLPGPCLLHEFVDGPLTAIELCRDRDEALAAAAGYRVTDTTDPSFTNLRAVDLFRLRLLASESLHHFGVTAPFFDHELKSTVVGEPITRSEPFIQFGAEHWLLNATPYLLPGRLGAELVTSEPPDPELVTRIRLPYETVLVFFDELDLDHLGFLEITATWTAQTDDEPVTVPVGPPTRTVLGVVGRDRSCRAVRPARNSTTAPTVPPPARHAGVSRS